MLEPEQQHPSLLALQALGNQCSTCSHQSNGQGESVCSVQLSADPLLPQQQLQHLLLSALQALSNQRSTCSHKINSQGFMVKQRLMRCSASATAPRSSSSSSSACCTGIRSPEQAVQNLQPQSEMSG